MSQAEQADSTVAPRASSHKSSAAMLSLRLARSPLTASIFQQLTMGDRDKLDEINMRLRHLHTMLGLVLYADGLDDSAKDVFALTMESLDSCLAISEQVEILQ